MIKKIPYILYQYLIAIPLMVLLTLFTAIITIIFSHWRNSWWLHSIQAFWSKSCFWLLFIPVKVTGLEHIRPGQSYVFVSNHQSMFDVWLIYGWLPVIYKWLMKYELRHMPFVGLACKAAGHVFVKRGNSRAAAESMREVERILTGGVSTVIFPEGTRTENGELGRFKRGAFQIALDLSLPIIPISLSGCYEVMNRHAWYATRHPVHMHVGKPIDISGYTKDNSHEAMETVRAAVEAGIDK